LRATLDPLHEHKQQEAWLAVLKEFKRQHGRLPRDSSEIDKWLRVMEKVLEKRDADKARAFS
jgi:hypothetical protein